MVNKTKYPRDSKELTLLLGETHTSGLVQAVAADLDPTVMPKPSKEELEYKAFAFDVFGEVLRNTPADTGRGKRANWHIEMKGKVDE